MTKVQVYDIPLRLFHLLFGALFVTAFLIGNLVDDESILYAYHMLSGLLMGILVILRLIWGIFGTKYSKLSSFHLRPNEIVGYFLSILKGNSKRELGHNPASSFAALIMFILTFGLIGTGLLTVIRFQKHFFEEVHELFAFVFLSVVVAHIFGVILHQMRHQDGIIFSMLSGKKTEVLGESPIKHQAMVPALIFIIILGFSASILLKNFTPEEGKLNLFGTSLQLVELEDE